MGVRTVTDAPVAPARGGRFTRSAGLLIAVGLLAFAALLSLAVGARSIPLADVVDALLREGSSQNETIIRSLRVTRTLLGIVVGEAIGDGGALMQALTRHPMTDHG